MNRYNVILPGNIQVQIVGDAFAVIEGELYITNQDGQLARAILIADQYARELKEGLKSDRDSAMELLAAMKAAEGGGGWDGNGSPLN